MIAIIAGTGFLPIAAARELAQRGEPFFTLCLFPADNEQQLAEAGPVITPSTYKLSSILAVLKKQECTEVVLIGKVDKRHLLLHLSYDWLLTKLLTKSLFKHDSTVVQLLIDELAMHGITTRSQRDLLSRLFVPAGVHTGTLTDRLQSDIALGMTVAENLSAHDIGQTVVVKNGMILAVEAIEGTDECIARGIMLGGGSVVVCKTARTTQSDQFDIPTLGPQTIAAYQSSDIAALAWQAERTFIAEYDQFLTDAKKKKITLIAQ